VISRRGFLASLGSAAAVPVVAQTQDSASTITQTMFGPMDEGAYRPVQLPPKQTARVLSGEDRDALERELKCQCGCTLDVYTCRTTDFTCPVSPAMHQDVVALVDGGYNAAEIREAFMRGYGEQVLMAPVRAGFNWVGYLLPFAVLAGGAAFVTMLARKWSHRRLAVAAASRSEPRDISLRDTERIDAAVRRDE
jgi:cytochrome c-type biogenesis protein CcmH